MRARFITLCLLPLATGCHLREHSTAAGIHHALDRRLLDHAALDQHPDNRALPAERFLAAVTAQSKGDPAR